MLQRAHSSRGCWIRECHEQAWGFRGGMRQEARRIQWRVPSTRIGSIPGEHSGAGSWAHTAAGACARCSLCVSAVVIEGCRHTPCVGNVEGNAEFQLTSEGVRQRPRSQSEGLRSSSSSEEHPGCSPPNSSAPYLWLAHPTEGSLSIARLMRAHTLTFASSSGTSPGNLRTYAGIVVARDVLPAKWLEMNYACMCRHVSRRPMAEAAAVPAA